jgi:hypothetical protein
MRDSTHGDWRSVSFFELGGPLGSSSSNSSVRIVWRQPGKRWPGAQRIFGCASRDARITAVNDHEPRSGSSSQSAVSQPPLQAKR